MKWLNYSQLREVWDKVTPCHSIFLFSVWRISYACSPKSPEQALEACPSLQRWTTYFTLVLCRWFLAICSSYHLPNTYHKEGVGWILQSFKAKKLISRNQDSLFPRTLSESQVDWQPFWDASILRRWINIWGSPCFLVESRMKTSLIFWNDWTWD